MWAQCPCAQKEIEAMPPPERPTCPYDQTTYNTALSDALAAAQRKPNPSPLDIHYAHNLAMLQVMLNRAAAELSQADLVEHVNASSENYNLQSSKPSAQLTAFTMLSREYRRFASLLEPRTPTDPEPEEILQQEDRRAADTTLDPGRLDDLNPPESRRSVLAMRCIRKAIEHARQGRDVEAMRACQDAYVLDPDIAVEREYDVAAAYRPTGYTLPTETVSNMIKAMREFRDGTRVRSPQFTASTTPTPGT
jgi:hypothetical protein